MLRNWPLYGLLFLFLVQPFAFAWGPLRLLDGIGGWNFAWINVFLLGLVEMGLVVGVHLLFSRPRLEKLMYSWPVRLFAVTSWLVGSLSLTAGLLLATPLVVARMPPQQIILFEDIFRIGFSQTMLFGGVLLTLQLYLKIESYRFPEARQEA